MMVPGVRGGHFKTFSQPQFCLRRNDELQVRHSVFCQDMIIEQRLAISTQRIAGPVHIHLL